MNAAMGLGFVATYPLARAIPRAIVAGASAHRRHRSGSFGGRSEGRPCDTAGLFKIDSVWRRGWWQCVLTPALVGAALDTRPPNLVAQAASVMKNRPMADLSVAPDPRDGRPSITGVELRIVNNGDTSGQGLLSVEVVDPRGRVLLPIIASADRRLLRIPPSLSI